MGDWSRGGGNFRLISDHDITNELKEMLGKPFSCDEMWYGNISEERYAKIPHSKEGSLDYHINCFQIKNGKCFDRKKDYTGMWLTKIQLYGYLRDGNDADITLEDWLLQVLTKYTVYEDNCGNYNYFKWADDYSKWQTWYTVRNGIIHKHDCTKDINEDTEFRNSMSWNGKEWINEED